MMVPIATTIVHTPMAPIHQVSEIRRRQRIGRMHVESAMATMTHGLFIIGGTVMLSEVRVNFRQSGSRTK